MKPHKTVLKYQASVATPLEKVYKIDKSCPVHLFQPVSFTFIHRYTQSSPTPVLLGFSWVSTTALCCCWVQLWILQSYIILQTCLLLLPNKDPPLLMCILTASCLLHVYSHPLLSWPVNSFPTCFPEVLSPLPPWRHWDLLQTLVISIFSELSGSIYSLYPVFLTTVLQLQLWNVF